MRENKTIKKLDLSNNNLTETVCSEFESLLNIHDSI